MSDETTVVVQEQSAEVTEQAIVPAEPILPADSATALCQVFGAHETAPEALPPSELSKCMYWFCPNQEPIGTMFRCASSNQFVCQDCYGEHLDGVPGIYGPCVPCQERRNWSRLGIL